MVTRVWGRSQNEDDNYCRVNCLSRNESYYLFYRKAWRVLGHEWVKEVLWVKNEKIYYIETALNGDISGVMSQLDEFLKAGNHHIDWYESNLDIDDNIRLECWYTDLLGYYTGRCIGLMIK